MVWPLIAAAAIQVIGGAMQGRGEAKAKDKELAASKEIARIQGQESRKTSKFEMELSDYYSQLNSQRNRNARASMYDKYSIVPKPDNFIRQPLVGQVPTETPVKPVLTANPIREPSP